MTIKYLWFAQIYIERNTCLWWLVLGIFLRDHFYEEAVHHTLNIIQKTNRYYA